MSGYNYRIRKYTKSVVSRSSEGHNGGHHISRVNLDQYHLDIKCEAS